jgi:uncharacterized membrane protein YcaP (DUF421 family)
MFFDNSHDLLRILVIGVCAYAGLIVLLRTTGKRTLSKMNAFDLIVTVALGSTLATVLLNKNVSLAEGMLAFALLCSLQYAVAFASVRFASFERLVKSEPTMLFFQGRFLDAALKKERVTRDEVLAAVRSQGVAELATAAAVVLETDGSLSVVRGGDATDSLRNVGGENKMAAQ